MKIEEPAPERFLYQLWDGEDLIGRRLCTVDGRSLEIVARGTRNLDAGPDFRGATVIIDGQMCCGDIEIHPVAVDWYRHGHHRDPRYNSVVLHVVTMEANPEERTTRQDGVEIPVLNLDQFLPKPAEQLADEGAPSTVPPAVDCALQRLSEAEILQVVEMAGDERLSTKCLRFQEERLTDDWDQILYRGFAEALGYAKNQVPFRKLADRLPFAEMCRAIYGTGEEVALRRAQAYLFGTAGLLPTPEELAGADAAMRDYVVALAAEWEAFPYRRKIDPLRKEEWLFFRLRPQNFPTRRIPALAALVVRFAAQGFLESLVRKVKMGARRIAHLGRELTAALSVEADQFWRSHYWFEAATCGAMSGGGRLLGPERAADMVVNIVFPCLMAYAKETDDGQLCTLLAQAYAQRPLLADNTIIRQMRHRLFARRPGAAVDSARRQQGLIQLWKTLCQQDGCARCLEHFQLRPSA
ncbi:MAG: DUF2851 family protein [bacterium]|jgi:hypothetical protein|nr:DUF2851 family protein [candidate division KSB1 bacterium]MDH7559007.1 DUF2851 family protein [bacterium]